jgi:hypothetical protein
MEWCLLFIFVCLLLQKDDRQARIDFFAASADCIMGEQSRLLNTGADLVGGFWGKDIFRKIQIYLKSEV